MKALFLTPSLSRNLGGIFEIERSLALELHRRGVEIDAAGLEDVHWHQDRSTWAPLEPQAYSVRGPRGFGYSPDLARHVMESGADVLHLHALWMYPSLLARRWGTRRNRPYLVTPNGMLEPWALANSRWKKRIAASIYEKGMLAGATCLQANTQKELEDFRAYGLRNPVAIIPNGVDLPADIPVVADRQGRRTLLFLGRLHPKKGLPEALRAWRQAGRAIEDWQLLIAGWDQGGHELELKGICDDLGIRHQSVPADQWIAGQGKQDAEVVFAGPAFGDDKAGLFALADAFILPSLSEGLPMAVLEAWSYGLPVMMTPECNLPNGFDMGAAILIETHADSISRALSCLREDSGDLKAMGQKGRQLVRECYTWSEVARQLHAVYQWMTGESSAPDCLKTTAR